MNNAYAGIFRMRLIAGMQYRAAAWAGVATQFFWGFMQLMVFAAFYRSSTSAAPMQFGHLADYIWLRQAFLALVMLWAQDQELLETIATGHVSYELCRPYRLYSFWFCRLLAVRLSNTLLRCFPIMFATFLLPEPYRFHVPPGWEAGGMFILSLALAVLLVVAVSMFIYLLTFLTLSPNGSRLVIGVTGEFLMGAIIPIPFMPEWMQRAMDCLPFRYMADLPFRIYSGDIAGAAAWRDVGVQIVWIAALTALGAFCFRRVTGRIVVQGG